MTQKNLEEVNYEDWKKACNHVKTKEQYPHRGRLMVEATENTTVNKGIDSSARKSEDSISICSKDSFNAMDRDTVSEEINGSTGLAEREPDGSSVFKDRTVFRKGMDIHLHAFTA
jgi:hypothetical protein